MDAVEEAPQRSARLMDGRYHDALLRGKLGHALHHHQRCIAVQACQQSFLGSEYFTEKT